MSPNEKSQWGWSDAEAWLRWFGRATFFAGMATYNVTVAAWLAFDDDRWLQSWQFYWVVGAAFGFVLAALRLAYPRHRKNPAADPGEHP